MKLFTSILAVLGLAIALLACDYKPETRSQRGTRDVYPELVALRDYFEGSTFTVTNEKLSAGG